MRKMTTEQAKMYIKAGYFPKPSEIEAICDLQDVFGHLPYHFIECLFIDEDIDIRENVGKLFRLISNKEEVNRFLLKANTYFDKKFSLAEVNSQIETLMSVKQSLEKEISKYERYMNFNWENEERKIEE